MENSLDIKSKLLKIQAGPLILPGQVTPSKAASLIRERELLLKIAIALEEQNQFLTEKLRLQEMQVSETVIRPVKKDKEVV